MAQTIKLKRSAIAGRVPTTSDLALGEVAINTVDGKMYIKKDVGGTESIVEIGSGAVSSSFLLHEYSVTTSQTVFSGSDDNSNTLAYDTGAPPRIQVFLNGVLLDYSTDYTATDGTSITLTVAATSGDLIQIAAYKSVTVDSNISLSDNTKILLGNDDDLEIYHDGSNSIINDAGTGNLQLQVGGTTVVETSASGLTVTGEITTDTLQITGGTGDAGTLSWNTEDETLDLIVSPDVTYQLGQEMGLVVRNLSGATLLNGTVVRVTGASGNKITVNLASANTELGSAPTVGVVTETIANNSTGRITTAGLVRNLNTSSFTEGVAIYLGTDGAFTATQPTSPNHLVHIGWVVRSHATEGMILVHVNNGWEIEELHNVLVTNVADNQILQYNSTSSVWENVAGTTSNIAEGTNLYWTTARGDSNFTTNLAASDTDDLSEGITNLYWTTARGDANFTTNIAASDTDDLSEGATNLYYTTARANADFDTRLATKSTTDLSEGTNLYYTTARFDTAFSGKSTTDLTEGTNLYFTNARARSAISVTGSLSYDSGTGVISYTTPTTIASLSNHTTDNLSEGTTNLYYTSARANADFDTRLATKSTTNLAEGTNLYYTSARANADFDTRLATKSTTNLAEGTNLYYTDARVGSYLTSNSYATQSYVSTAISNLVDSAPATLDTLNELAAALGDDPNFATTVSTSIGTKWTQDNTKISNWDTAYSWGNHASAGYLPSSSYTASDVLTKIKTVDGSGSGLDADTLDGTQLTAITRSGSSVSLTGQATGSGTVAADGSISISTTVSKITPIANDTFGGSYPLLWYANNIPYTSSWMYVNGTTDTLHVPNVSASSGMLINGSTVWNAGNDGSGSGLDADLLDGVQGSQFLRSDVDDTFTGGALTIRNALFLQVSGSDGAVQRVDARDDATNYSRAHWYGTSDTGATSNFRHAWYDGNSYVNVTAENDGVTFTGTLNPTQGYKVNGTTVIDSSRNLTNIGTLNGGTPWTSSNDGSGSGLDADLLDGIDSSSFLRSDTSDTFSGLLTVSRNGNTATPGYTEGQIELHTSSNYYPAIGFHRGGYSATTLYEYDGQLYVNPWVTRAQAGLLLSSGNIGSYAWTSSNDGSGSGLDADLLDGVHASGFVQQNGTYTLASGYSVAQGDWGLRNTTPSGWIQFGPANTTWAHIYSSGMSFYFNQQLYVLGNIVWNSANDGSGSGLDADLLDGQHGSYYLDAANFTGTAPTGSPFLSNFVHLGTATTAGYATDDGNWGSRLNVSSNVHAKIEVSQEANSMRSHWYAHTGQDSIKFGTSTSHDVEFQRASTTYLELESGGVKAYAPIRRSNHHATGFLEGSYNNIGDNATKTNPIYTIGSNYNPAESTLSNMYGIGYCYTSATFLSGSTVTGGAGWGFYVASDGDARIFLNAGNGTISTTGQHYAAGSTVWNAGNDGSGSGLDADLLDGIDSSRIVYGSNSNKTNNTGSASANLPSGFYDQYQGDMPTATYYSYLNIRHTNVSNHHGAQIAVSFYSPDLYTRHYQGGDSSGNGSFSAWDKHWRAGNDGSGSGLDADLLDGQHGSYYATASHNHSGVYLPISGKAADSELLDGLNSTAYMRDDGWNTSPGQDANSQSQMKSDFSYSNNAPHTGELIRFGAGGYSLQLSSAYQSAGNLSFRTYNNDSVKAWNAWATVWNSVNDGSGSGLDADLLDGQHGSYYAPASHTHSYVPLGGGTMTGQLNMHAAAYEGSITFGSNTTWRCGIRQHDDADAELRIWAKNANGMIFLATGYDGEPTSLSRPTDGLVIQGNKVGIGNFSSSDPGYKLQVSGTTYSSDTLYAYAFRGHSNVAGTGEASYHPAGIYSTSNNWLYGTIYRNGTDTYSQGGSMYSTNRIVCDQNYGNGLFGVYSATRYQHVWSMGTSYALATNGTSVGNLYGISWTHTNIGTGTNQAIAGLSHQMQIRANGSLWCAFGNGIWTTGNITAYSDISVKTNLERIPNALEKVCQINGYTYDRTDYKPDSEGIMPETRQAGVVAQEVEKVLPEVVSGEEGNKAVAYGNMVALLIEAIKEQQQTIQALSARVEELENK